MFTEKLKFFLTCLEEMSQNHFIIILQFIIDEHLPYSIFELLKSKFRNIRHKAYQITQKLFDKFSLLNEECLRNLEHNYNTLINNMALEEFSIKENSKEDDLDDES